MLENITIFFIHSLVPLLSSSLLKFKVKTPVPLQPSLHFNKNSRSLLTRDTFLVYTFQKRNDVSYTFSISPVVSNFTVQSVTSSPSSLVRLIVYPLIYTQNISCDELLKGKVGKLYLFHFSLLSKSKFVGR